MSVRGFLAPLVGALLFGTSVSNAATVTFSNTSIAANLNDIITVDVMMDFTGDPTLGGGLDIFYEPSILSFVSFDFGTSDLVLDLGLSRAPDVVAPNKLEGLAFSGGFNGIAGPGTVGTLTFQAVSVGAFTLTMADTTEALDGGRFISATDFFTEQTIAYGTADVSVTGTVVPVPAAVWLFASGLMGLTGVAAKRKTV